MKSFILNNAFPETNYLPENNKPESRFFNPIEGYDLLKEQLIKFTKKMSISDNSVANASKNSLPANNKPKIRFLNPIERYDFTREQGIDFTKQRSITDNSVANACYEVFTSDGKIGTINHLYYVTDPKLFAEDLRRRLGNGIINICVTGGDSDFPMSGNLLLELERQGFVIKGYDIGGKYSRQGTLFKDRVELIRIPFGKNKIEEKYIFLL